MRSLRLPWLPVALVLVSTAPAAEVRATPDPPAVLAASIVELAPIELGSTPGRGVAVRIELGGLPDCASLPDLEVGVFVDVDLDPTTGTRVGRLPLGADAKVSASCNDGVLVSPGRTVSVSSGPGAGSTVEIRTTVGELPSPIFWWSPYALDGEQLSRLASPGIGRFTIEEAVESARGLELEQGASSARVRAPGAGLFTQTVTYDPTPRRPGSGDECTIKIESGVLTPFGPVSDERPDSIRAVRRIRRTLEDLLDRSKDMRRKVREACRRYGNMITIGSARGQPIVSGGVAVDGGIGIDTADLDAAPEHMQGKPEDVDLLAANLLAFVLAHEFDHLRDFGGSSHDDPPAGKGGIGPPDEDANRVMADLGIPIHRNTYGTTGTTDGHTVTTFTVDGQPLVWDLTAWLEAIAPLRPDEPSVTKTVDPGKVTGLANEPCPSSQPCYPAATEGDADADGVPDGKDRCPVVADPGRTDVDGDGAGAACDLDDDGDGYVDVLELATGATDMRGASRPEHWAVGDTCADGKDQDRDGFVDAGDMSCAVPPIATVTFPEPTPSTMVFPDPWRLDLGGVPERFDVVQATMTLDLDLNLDGLTDEQAVLDGPVVIGRDPPVTSNGVRQMRHSILAWELVGSSPTLGPVVVQVDPDRPSGGLAYDFDPNAPGDLPASTEFDVPFSLIDLGPNGVLGTDDDTSLHTQTPVTIGCFVDTWPPYSFEYSIRSPTPVPLLDEAQTVTIQINNMIWFVDEQPSPGP